MELSRVTDIWISNGAVTSGFDRSDQTKYFGLPGGPEIKLQGDPAYDYDFESNYGGGG